MGKSSYERRTEQNEAVFRDANMRVQQGIDKLNDIAREDGVEPQEFDSDMVLRFYCECSDENCTQRIRLSLKDYNIAHQSNDTFTIKPGHEVANIEETIFSSDEYNIVKKYKEPPSTATELKATPVDNS